MRVSEGFYRLSKSFGEFRGVLDIFEEFFGSFREFREGFGYFGEFWRIFAGFQGVSKSF